MDEFVEHLMYAGLCSGDSEMNQTHPCQQGAPGLVGETVQGHTTVPGLEAGTLESRRQRALGDPEESLAEPEEEMV